MPLDGRLPCCCAIAQMGFCAVCCCGCLQLVRELAVPDKWEVQDPDLVALLTQETVQVGLPTLTCQPQHTQLGGCLALMRQQTAQ